MKRILLRAIPALAVGMLWSQSVLAQEPEACFAPGGVECTANIPAIPFDLLPPGARALGLGGAFAAVADDATAAEANPAGQTILTRPEVSLHGRHADYDITVFDPNALDGLANGAVGPGPVTGYDDTNTKVSFASFVYPFERFVLSAYYQNTGQVEGSSNIQSFNSRFIDTYNATSTLSAEQESFGISGAFRVNDLISIGASIKYAKLELEYATASSILDFSDVEFLVPGDPAANANQINELDALLQLSNGDDHDIAWNAGILVNPNGKVSFGLVYKDGGSYEVDNQVAYLNVFNCNGLAGCTVAPVDELTLLDSNSRNVELPDIFSIGIAARPTDTWLLSLQVDRIDYGDLPPPTATSLIFGQPANVDELGAEISVHAGAEKTFLFDQPILGMSLLNVRAGIFTDRDHDGYSDIDTDTRHYTFGLGTVFGENFQLDIAAEWSERVDNVVMSGVYRF
jgi:long-chain fatty acid transport protein